MKARPFIRRSESRKLKEKNPWGINYMYNATIANISFYDAPINYGQVVQIWQNQPVVINEDTEYYNAAQGQMQYQGGVVEG